MQAFEELTHYLTKLDTKFLLNLLTTTLYVGVLLGLRHLIYRQLEKKEWGTDTEQVKVFARIRQIIFILILFGLIVVWLPEIRSFAFSIAAITVAIVIASKELIMCLSGAFLKSTNDVFSIGDRIQVGTYRGDVLDSGFLTTDMFEVDKYHQKTGRIITIPNSLFLNTPVINESLVEGYTLIITKIPLKTLHGIYGQAERLLQIIHEVTQDYLEEATRRIKRHVARSGLREPTADPRVILKLDHDENYYLIARYPVPAHKKLVYEQHIIKRFIEEDKRK